MKRLRVTFVAALLAAFALSAPVTIAEEPATAGVSAKILLARAIEAATAPQCTAGTADTRQCGSTYTRVAAGAECPATSGKYCSDKLPYCCGTPGNYYCAKDVNGC